MLGRRAVVYVKGVAEYAEENEWKDSDNQTKAGKRKNYPNSVIRDRTDYVRMSSRLSAAFAKGVAGYAEEERQRRCRQSTEISR